MFEMNEKTLVAFIVQEWLFKIKGGKLSNFLKAANECFGDFIYGKIWSSLVDIWECIDDNGCLESRRVETVAQGAGLDLSKDVTWRNLKQKEKKYVR